MSDQEINTIEIFLVCVTKVTEQHHKMLDF